MVKQIKVQSPLSQTYRWIEGVGNMDNSFAPGTEWANDYSWHWFKCVLNNEELYYSESNTCSFVGLEDFEKRPLENYANPSTTIFNVQMPSEALFVAKKLNVYSLSGTLIMTKKIENEPSFVDAASLSRGIYIVEIVAEEESFYGKIVKE